MNDDAANLDEGVDGTLPNGQVTVAGEFKGTATWDGFTLASIPDPETTMPPTWTKATRST